MRDQLLGFPDFAFSDRGHRRVKNIDRPIRVYSVTNALRNTADHQLSLARIRVGLPSTLGKALRSGPHATLLSTAALAAALTVAISTLPTWRGRAPSVQPTLLVLPFSNFSGDHSQDYLADAITDDLTTDLSRVPGTFVVASDTAFTYKGKAVDVRQIGQECGVQYILEGSVERLENKVKTNARLIDAASGVQLWGESFKSGFTELARLQDAIVGQIASSLRIQLVQAEDRRAIAERPADPDSTDLRLHAMALLVTSHTPDHHFLARDYLRESLKIDENSAEGQSELAHLLMNDYYSHWLKPGEKLPDLLHEAEIAVQKALIMDPSIATAHQADGLIHRANGDHLGARDAFDRAIQLDPNFARAWAQKANELVMLGQPNEALPLAFKATKLSPHDPVLPVFHWIIGRAYFVIASNIAANRGQSLEYYNQAISWLRKSVEMMGNVWYSRAWLVSAYWLSGRDQENEAKTARDNFIKDFPEHTIKRIRDVYEHENPQRNPVMTQAIDKLEAGLRDAGVPEQLTVR